MTPAARKTIIGMQLILRLDGSSAHVPAEHNCPSNKDDKGTSPAGLSNVAPQSLDLCSLDDTSCKLAHARTAQELRKHYECSTKWSSKESFRHTSLHASSNTLGLFWSATFSKMWMWERKQLLSCTYTVTLLQEALALINARRASGISKSQQISSA